MPKKSRSIHELLKVMLTNKEYLVTGLCFLSERLYMYRVITGNEYVIVNSYLMNNPPIEDKESYWWPPGEIKPRISWLKKHIKLTKP